MDIELRGLEKRYGATVALDGVSLGIRAGEFFTLLGPSGCGKTTTLRSIAGFVMPTAGDVLIKGARVNDVPPHRRRVGMVFQHYALFPHRTVFQNVAFGLRMQGTPRADIPRRVGDALGLVRLAGYGERYPRQLSGGEQQRVALARALVTRPSVLLLDEPLGALDKKLRDEMQIELRRLVHEVGITALYVTHDQEEALTMSDRIAVMRAGRVEQVGTPTEIYEAPASVFVADFIGDTNLLRGRMLADGIVDGNGVKLRVGPCDLPPGHPVTLALRPEKIRLEASAAGFATGREAPEALEDGPEALVNTVGARVAHVVYQGETVRYVITTDAGQELQTVELGRIRFAPGDQVRAGWAAVDCRVLST